MLGLVEPRALSQAQLPQDHGSTCCGSWGPQPLRLSALYRDQSMGNSGPGKRGAHRFIPLSLQLPSDLNINVGVSHRSTGHGVNTWPCCVHEYVLYDAI